jgi:hypothetical protein
MSYSYLCAVSGQSIPVYSVEPTPIVVVLPDGALMTGTWDGYGYVLPLGVDPMAAAAQVRTYFTPEFHLPRRLAQLLGVDAGDGDAIAAAVRMVKARFFEPDRHSYASLPVSPPCPHKGLLYRDSGEWNNPKRPAAKAANLPPWLTKLRGDREKPPVVDAEGEPSAAEVPADPTLQES